MIFANVHIIANGCVLRDEVRLVLITGQEYSQTIGINGDEEPIREAIFTANGQYLISSGEEGIQAWRVEDGERVAMMKLKDVLCVAVSKDGRFITAGALWAEVFVWDARTYEQVFAVKIPGGPTIRDVDFSPDSTRLVCTNCEDKTATIWDIAARKKVQTFDHGQSVFAAKYSPQGDRIATATRESIQVWDSNDGRLLVDVNVGLKPWKGLLWFDNHLFVKTEDSNIG